MVRGGTSTSSSSSLSSDFGGFAGGRLLGIRVSKDFFVRMESSLGFLFSKSPVRISYL